MHVASRAKGSLTDSDAQKPRIPQVTFRPTPVLVILASVLAAVAAAAIATGVAINQPWLGLQLSADGQQQGLRVVSVSPSGPANAIEPGAVIERIGKVGEAGFALTAFDIAEEPDAVVESYGEFERFYERQGAIADIIAAAEVRFSFADGTTTTISPAPMRPLADLPVGFWVQLSVGIVSVLIGVSVWTLRPGVAGAWILGIGSVVLVMSAHPSAIYLTRELALPESLFRVLGAINHFGSLIFTAMLFVLFLVYPARLVPAFVPVLIVAFCLGAWLTDVLRIGIGDPVTLRYVLVGFLAVAAVFAICVQYWRAAGDPVRRSALRWIILALVVAIGIYLVVYWFPTVTGRPNLATQVLAYPLGLIVYSGIALSVLRYRLFDLDRWMSRVLSYVAIVLIFLAIDFALVTVIALDYLPAFGIAVAAVALIYLPLRDVMARWIIPAAPERHRFFDTVVDVALVGEYEERDQKWEGLLRDAFEPLSIETASGRHEPAITEHGAYLTVPGSGVVTARQLGFANRGRRLFNRRDVDLAAELCRMLSYVHTSRMAHEDGVAQERARIARDTHDNIGAKLLSALHGGKPDRKNAMIREALSDLRDIINASGATPRTADETLAELRHETAERVSAEGLEMRWSVSGAETADPPPAIVHSLRSIIREAVTNVIRHANASVVTIAVDLTPEATRLSIADNGTGFDPMRVAQGHGLESMKTRAETLQGAFAIDTGSHGTTISVSLPHANALAES